MGLNQFHEDLGWFYEQVTGLDFKSAVGSLWADAHLIY